MPSLCRKSGSLLKFPTSSKVHKVQPLVLPGPGNSSRRTFSCAGPAVPTPEPLEGLLSSPAVSRIFTIRRVSGKALWMCRRGRPFLGQAARPESGVRARSGLGGASAEVRSPQSQACGRQDWALPGGLGVRWQGSPGLTTRPPAPEGPVGALDSLAAATHTQGRLLESRGRGCDSAQPPGLLTGGLHAALGHPGDAHLCSPLPPDAPVDASGAPSTRGGLISSWSGVQLETSHPQICTCSLFQAVTCRLLLVGGVGARLWGLCSHQHAGLECRFLKPQPVL